jgi:hypothetical protein
VTAHRRRRGKSRLCRLLLAALLLLLTGCSELPFRPTELVPVTPRRQAELSAGMWSSGRAPLLIRQSALFELMGMRVPLAGIMKLDTGAGSARLVGMNDMGVKLYDISVDCNSSHANFVIPDLARYPGFADAVAASVRRIFLEPAPAEGDALTLRNRSYLLTRDSDDGKVSFSFGGADAQLLEKRFEGKKQSWRVGYYQYQRSGDLLFPGGIVLDDQRAGYRLTLWIESVEKTDE